MPTKFSLKNYKKSPHLAEVELIYKHKVASSKRLKIESSSEAAEVLQKVWSNKIEYVEEFLILGVDASGKLLGWVKLSSGGINQTIFDAKLIFQAAILMNASGIILSHNHPSGSVEPSTNDKEATQKIKDGGKLLDIQILDHIIITSEGYYSFADAGLIQDESKYEANN